MQKKKFNLKNHKGITLTALIITIIVILIIAGILLAVFRKNGVIGNSEKSIDAHIRAEEKEKIKLAYNSCEVDYQTYGVAITAQSFQKELRERDKNTKVTDVKDEEAETGELVVDRSDASGYAKVEFTKTEHLYYIALANPDLDRDFTIEYDLDGGTATGNPTTYNRKTPTFTLNNPTKYEKIFEGWSGTDISSVQEIVTIQTGSMGNRKYTAHWLDPVFRLDNPSSTEYYMLLKDALDHAENGARITLLRDNNDESDKLVNTKNVILNVDSHNLNIKTTLVNNSSLTIKGVGSIKSAITTIENNGKLQIGENDGTVTSALVIRGEIGINNNKELYFFDGQIVGKKAVNGGITKTATDYVALSTKKNDIETVVLGNLSDHQARISNVYYDTLGEALEDVEKDETITLLTGLSMEKSIEIPNTKEHFTLDLYGHTISMSNEDYLIKNYSDLEITDTSSEKNGALENSNFSVIYNAKNSILTISDGTINVKKEASSFRKYEAINNKEGKLYIKRGTVKSEASQNYVINNYGGEIKVEGGYIYGQNGNIGIYNEDINCINLSRVKDGGNNFNFNVVNDELVATLEGRKNVERTVHSYFEIDLSDKSYDETTDVVVNAKTESFGSYYENAYAVITDLPGQPDYSEIRRNAFMSCYQNTGSKDYKTTLHGGKKYYLHFIFTKSRYSDSENSKFIINSIYVQDKNDETQRAKVEMVGGKIESQYGIYNKGENDLNLQNCEIVGNEGIINYSNSNINVLDGVSISTEMMYGTTACIENRGNGTITVDGNNKLATKITWNGDESIPIKNMGNGNVVVKNGYLYSYTSGGSNGSGGGTYGHVRGIGIDNQGSGNVTITGGKIQEESYTYGNCEIAAVYNVGSGTITIDGGEILSELKPYNSTSNSKIFTVGNIGSGKVEIRGGKIDGKLTFSDQYPNYRESGYVFTIGNSGDGEILIDGNATITGTDSDKSNTGTVGNIGKGKINIYNGNISNERNSIYCNNGTVNINKSLKGTIYNIGGKINIGNEPRNGAINISSASKQSSGIINDKGKINLGAINKNSDITITGSNYGISNESEFGYYAGTIKGKNAIYGVISEIQSGKDIDISTEGNLEVARLVDTRNEKTILNVTTGIGYGSLQDAIMDIPASSQAKLKVLKNTLYITRQSGKSLDVNNGKNIELDINGAKLYFGNKFTNDSSFTLSDSSNTKGKVVVPYGIVNNKNFTIGSSVNIESSSRETKIIDNFGKLVVNGTITYFGENISGHRSYIIYNEDSAQTTLNDGAEINSKSYTTEIYNGDNGNIYINGGKINAIDDSVYAVYNASNGIVNINKGTLTNTSSGNGWNKGVSSTSIVRNMKDGTININGGDFRTRYDLVSNLGNGNIIIKGGNFKILDTEKYPDEYTSISNNGTGNLEIYNGTFKCKVSNTNSGNIKIYGGTIEQGVSNSGRGSIIIGKDDGKIDENNPIILPYRMRYGSNTSYGLSSTGTGKVFFYDGIIKGIKNYWNVKNYELPSEYMIEEYEETTNGTTYNCAKIVRSDPVAKIEETNTEYRDIKKAIDYVQNSDKTKLTLTLLKDSILDKSLEITEEKNVTINLNTHKLQFSTMSDDGKTADIINHGKLCIKNGTLYHMLTQMSSDANEINTRMIIDNFGDIKLGNNLTINNEQENYINFLYNENGATATINANIELFTKYQKSTVNGIYNDDNANVTINGGSFSIKNYWAQNTTNIIYNAGSGNVIINDGTIKNQISYSYYTHVNTINNNTNGSIVINGGDIENYANLNFYTVINRADGLIQVNGGTLKGYYAVFNSSTGTINIGNKDGNINTDKPVLQGEQYAVAKNDGKINFYDGTLKGIYGGTKNGFSDIEESSEIIQSTESIDEKEYKVLKLEKVASNIAKVKVDNVAGEKQFNKLIDAINYAKQNGTKATIALLRNCTLVDKIVIDKDNSITFDLNNYTINAYVDSDSMLQNNGELTITNGKIVSDQGGIYIDYSKSNYYRLLENNGKMHLINNFKIENSATLVYGIYNNKDAELEVENSEINSNNENISLSYHGIHNNDGTVEIRNSKVITTGVGGISNISNTKNGKVTIENTEISIASKTKRDAGGTMYGIDNRGTLETNNTSISFNYLYDYVHGTSYAVGGMGVYGISNAGSARVTETTITNITGRTKRADLFFINSYGIDSTGNVDVRDSNINTNIERGESSNDYGINNTGTLNVYTSEIKSSDYGLSNTGIATIGEVSNNIRKTTPSITGDIYGVVNQKGTLNFFEGEINGKNSAVSGKITKITEKYVVKILKNGEYFREILTPEAKNNMVVFGNGTYFNSLQQAIDVCEDENTQYELTLINGIENEKITIGDKQNIVLDLNGYTISSTLDDPIITNNGKLKIVDNSFDEEKTKFGRIVSSKGTAIRNNKDLTIGEEIKNDTIIQAPIIEGKAYSIYNNDKNCIVKMYDGKIIGKMENVTISDIPENCEIDNSITNQITLKKKQE